MMKKNEDQKNIDSDHKKNNFLMISGLKSTDNTHRV